MSELSERLRQKMALERLTLRQAEERIGVPRATLGYILNNPNSMPQIDTIEAIAGYLELPLWRAMAMVGLDLNLPVDATSQAERLYQLFQARPQLREALDRLLELTPNDLESVLVFLETQERRRQSSDAE